MDLFLLGLVLGMANALLAVGLVLGSTGVATFRSGTPDAI